VVGRESGEFRSEVLDHADAAELEEVIECTTLEGTVVNINPARKMVMERKELVVTGGVTIVTGRGATPCWVWSATVGSKESSDGHRVTRWTL
jgi:hypothetical protein